MHRHNNSLFWAAFIDLHNRTSHELFWVYTNYQLQWEIKQSLGKQLVKNTFMNIACSWSNLSAHSRHIFPDKKRIQWKLTFHIMVPFCYSTHIGKVFTIVAFQYFTSFSLTSQLPCQTFIKWTKTNSIFSNEVKRDLKWKTIILMIFINSILSLPGLVTRRVSKPKTTRQPSFLK